MTHAAAQPLAPQRVEWHHGPRVDLNAPGSSYSFTGGVARTETGCVLHTAQIALPAGSQRNIAIGEVRYELAPFATNALPPWLEEAPTPTLECHAARDAWYATVRIPAFRLTNGRLERLSAYTLVPYRGSSGPPQSQTLARFMGAPTSRLAQGAWAKIAVRRSGVYRIEYSQIMQLGLGNPADLSVWGHDGRQLPYENASPNLDDLVQIPIYWVSATPETPGPGDYALVFLPGVSQWVYDPATAMFRMQRHEFSDRVHYFITASQPARTITTGAPQSATHRQSHYWRLAGLIGQEVNLAFSGRERFGAVFDHHKQQRIGSGITPRESGGAARIWVRFAAASSQPSWFDFKLAGQALGQLTFTGISTNESNICYARVAETTLQAEALPGGEVALEAAYSSPTPSSRAWLSRVMFNVRDRLEYSGSPLLFFSDSVGPVSDRQALDITGLQAGVELWDVGNPFAPVRYADPSVATVSAGARQRLYLFAPGAAPRVEIVGRIGNQNLHAMPTPDMLIVTHGRFRQQAEAIAQIYRESPLTRLRVEVVDVEEVYNEFSSGTRDVSAIRNLARMHYWRSGGPTGHFRFLQLFGKPLHTMKDTEEAENLVPNWQSLNSWDRNASYGTDDFFALLDPDEGGGQGLMDIAVGRYSVAQAERADLIVRHEAAYHNPSNWGEWLSNGMIIADDEEESQFMRDADSLLRYLRRERPERQIKPFFADAFKQVHYWHNAQYPDLTAALDAHMERGTGMCNYMGHAGYRQIGTEGFLLPRDFYQWRNLNHLPIFVSASCHLAENDFNASYSLGEEMLFLPQGGAIATISSSRLALINYNFDFNSQLTQAMYPPAAAPPVRTLGEAVRLAKVRTPNNANKRKFLLLGSPALPLLNGIGRVELTALQGATPSASQDTLRAHQEVSLDLALTTEQGAPFNGTAYVTVQGPLRRVTTKGNEPDPPFSYEERTTTAFRGPVTARDGRAQVRFIIPTDMNADYGEGLCTFFGVSDNGFCSGSYQQFIIGGVAPQTSDDREGPEITLSLNDYARRARPVVNGSPLLIVRLRDSSGINISGAGKGHDLRFTLRGEGIDREGSLNDFYQPAPDNPREGEARYRMAHLEPGKYTIEVRAWDIYNNPSAQLLSFEVVEAGKPAVSHLLNYPNPFTKRTAFYFDGTRPGQPADVTIQIFTVGGKLVKQIRAFEPSPGVRFGPYMWDGRDDWGRPLGRGVYFYRVHVRHRAAWPQEGGQAECFESLLKL